MAGITRFALEAGIAASEAAGAERVQDIAAHLGGVAPIDIQEPRLPVCANRVRSVHLQRGVLLRLAGERDAPHPDMPRGVLAEDAGLLAGCA